MSRFNRRALLPLNCCAGMKPTHGRMSIAAFTILLSEKCGLSNMAPWKLLTKRMDWRRRWHSNRLVGVPKNCIALKGSFPINSECRPVTKVFSREQTANALWQFIYRRSISAIRICVSCTANGLSSSSAPITIRTPNIWKKMSINFVRTNAAKAQTNHRPTHHVKCFPNWTVWKWVHSVVCQFKSQKRLVNRPKALIFRNVIQLIPLIFHTQSPSGKQSPDHRIHQR